MARGLRKRVLVPIDRGLWGIAATCLLVPSNVYALTVSEIELAYDGALLTTVERDQLVNEARCECGESVEATIDFGSIGAGGEVVLAVGTRCIDSDERLDDSCTTLWRSSIEDLSSSESVTLSFAELSDGCAADEATRSLFVLVDEDDEDRWVSIFELSFGIDTEPPDAPSKSDLVPGEGLVEVAFEAAEDAPTATRYQVLCALADEPVFDDPEDAGFASIEDSCGEGTSGGARAAFVCAKASTSAASVTVSGLENESTYTFFVVAIDEAGNPSALVELGEATPAPEEDLWERYKRSGGSADGGNCFVATAAFDDYDHPTVRWLRVFRDTQMATSSGGRSLIRAYYEHSPPAAATIAEHPLLRHAARRVVERFRDFALSVMLTEGAR